MKCHVSIRIVKASSLSFCRSANNFFLASIPFCSSRRYSSFEDIFKGLS